MAYRIEISTTVNDKKSEVMLQNIRDLSFDISAAKVIEVYTLPGQKTDGVAQTLSNPISQTYRIDSPTEENFDFALEIGFLPGVTDNIGATAKETVEDFLKVNFKPGQSVHSSTLILLSGKLTKENVEKIGKTLANELIQRIHIKSAAEYGKNGMNIVIPKVNLAAHPKADQVNLDISEEELEILSKQGIKNKDGTRRGPLALEKSYMDAIKKYFKEEGRNPTDIELESLAQTWSEHCKHTIFAAKIDNLTEGLYKGLIKKATNDIRKTKGDKDFCVSVFSDNSGGIIFDDDWIITDKAETHNSPSALDPFGGAITGIVGVNRDTVGFGLGAKPIANKYGFLVGLPDDTEPVYRDKDLTTPALSPRRILNGIIDGVEAGGNQSGIPTPQGYVYFDDSYKGKPLVFVGTVGLIPKEINGKPSWEKKALPGDKVVVIGGKVGQDGIHGATFSSEALTVGSPATAVQIGDPITQKKLSDAIVKEARDRGLYNSITDNGAGGISCSIAEMAKESGGCEVDLEKVPLKYPNLEPWEIWISESQERMTLSIPENKLQEFNKLMESRGVESAVIGEFTDSGRCVVRFKGEEIMNLDMDFLHDGLPKKTLITTYTRPKHDVPNFAEPEDLTDTLHAMLEQPNITSYEWITRQYDHTVQGGAVLGPMQGKGRVNALANVFKPYIGTDKAIAITQALNPRYSEIDTYHMAASAIDTAVRNTIAVGGDLDHMALMDNFCWCSSTEKERLGQLKATVQACYDYAIEYGTPFISGKDSMFNDFKGFDKNGEPIKISALPTLMISAISVMNDATKSISMDLKIPGDLVYILGETKNELGGSEYFASKNSIGNTVPQVHADKAISMYRKYMKAVDRRLIASAFSVGLGGIGIALAKKAIAGQLGLDVDLQDIPKSPDLDRNDYTLFSETQSRFIVTVAPGNKEAFEKEFTGHSLHMIGKVLDSKKFTIKNMVSTNIFKLEEHYKSTFKNF